LAALLLLSACSDDPSGVSSPELQFELANDRVETFQPVELHVDAGSHGAGMMFQHGELDVEQADGDWMHTFSMTQGTHGFDGTLMFFRPGEHELRFRATGGGGMVEDIGHHQVTVHRQHRVIGPYWVEFEVILAPVLVETTAQLRFHVFDWPGDDLPGEPVSGLDATLTIHDPAGAESNVSLVESESGLHTAEHEFGAAGLYELHLAIDVGGTLETGDFHLPVLASSEDDGLDHRDHHGGHGRDHGG
jgi:hypothetical protein